MVGAKNSKRLLVMALLCLLTGCSFGDEPSLCPYNVRMEYWYAGSNVENVLPVYVDNLRQYLYDSEGKLLSVSTLRGDSVAGWTGNLADGHYTVVLWGNLGDEGKAAEESVSVEGTILEDMTLSAVTEGVPPGFRGNTGRLYFGTATLDVGGGGTHLQRVYLSHAHAALSITVQWMADKPAAGGVYRMRLKGTPAIYGFRGHREITTPGGDGTYAIPRIDGTVTYHETRAAMNYEDEVIGNFVTYRYTSGTHPIWSLWRDGKQIIRDLDLSVFFRKLPMDLDTNMEQEFDLLVTVYEDKIVVTQATLADWDEGGTIG